MLELTVQLNGMHNVDRSVRYWRILLGPWLGYFVQILFDRWSSIQQGIREQELSETIVLDCPDAALIPGSMVDFQRLMVGDRWNHHVYGSILRQFTQVPCISQRSAEATPGPSSPGGRGRSAKEALAAAISRVAGALVRDSDAFFLSTYLPVREEIKLHGRLGQMPQFWRFVAAASVAVDSRRRKWVVAGESRSEFEACVRALIPAQMPAVYLEGYTRLIEQAAQVPWPRHPKLIWTSNSHSTDDVFKAYAADKVQGGTPLVIGQHGGHWGVGRWSFVEDHDVAIMDRFLSWGWSSARHPNVKPACQLKVKRPLGVQHARQPGALLVTGASPRFSYWMYAAIVARQWLDYFNDQCAFVARLPRPIQDALTVRLYPEDYGWDQVARWRERLPEVRLDQGQTRMNDLIRHSRLYISTYNATTFLESMTMNVPSVIYWNVNHWELRDSAAPYFDDLARVGVFHATPESAADHVARVWDDIDAWWSDPALQSMLARFKQRYCRESDDVPGCIEPVLREVMTAADAAVAR